MTEITCRGRQVMRVISHTAAAAAAESYKQPEAHWQLSVVSIVDVIVTCHTAFTNIKAGLNGSIQTPALPWDLLPCGCFKVEEV